MFALYFFPISNSWIYTLEEAEQGIALDLIGALEEFKRKNQQDD